MRKNDARLSFRQILDTRIGPNFLFWCPICKVARKITIWKDWNFIKYFIVILKQYVFYSYQQLQDIKWFLWIWLAWSKHVGIKGYFQLFLYQNNTCHNLCYRCLFLRIMNMIIIKMNEKWFVNHEISEGYTSLD